MPETENEARVEYHEPILYQATENFIYTEVINEVVYFYEPKPFQLQAVIELEKNFYFNKI